jgi:hypothetical protein
MTLTEAIARIAELERANESLRRDLLTAGEDLLAVGACNDGLRAELSALKTGTMRGAAGLYGGTAAEKRQRFMHWPARLKRRPE